MHTRITDIDQNILFLSVIYGSPQKDNCKELWQCLSMIGSSVNGPWCIFGDLNDFLCGYEKMGEVKMGVNQI